MVRVFNDTENQRVEFLDQRFYLHADGNYYPSVTTVLEAYPKGKRFEQWLKDVGNEAEDIVDRAATQGTNVHEAIERLLKGQSLEWINFTLDEWQMILKFKEFFDAAKLVIEGIEVNIVSPTLGVGGTIDLVCTINGERWLIDFKTSSAIYDNHFVQIATYAMMWNEAYPEQRIERIGVLHLRAATRGPSRDGSKLQGSGWKLDEASESPAELFELFKHVKVLWHRINPAAKPMNKVLPSVLRLDVEAREVASPAWIKKEVVKVVMPFEEAV